MSDLIDRQAAIEAIGQPFQPRSDFEVGMCESRYGSIGRIKAILAEDVIQAKRGCWVPIGDEPYDTWKCSQCGFVIDGSRCLEPEEYRDIYNFCPHCGADMRGGRGE